LAFLTLYVTLSDLVLDRPEAARELLDQERLRLAPPYSAFHLWVAFRTAHNLLYRGDGAAALEYMDEEYRGFDASACSRPCGFSWRALAWRPPRATRACGPR
jgi:hypothetical protein